MQLKAGLRYRTRGGTKSPPLQRHAGGVIFVWKTVADTGVRTYTANGREMAMGDSPFDLLEPLNVPASDKMICDVTLEDYRRGIANM